MNFNVYKDLKLIYILGCIIGIPLFAVIFALSGVEIGGIVINEIFLLLLFGVVLSIIATKRVDKLLEKYDNCQIKEFVEAYEELLERENKHEDVLVFNLSAGYISSGQYEKAEYLLSTVKFANKKGIMAVTPKAMYYNNLCALYLGLENKELAQKYFEELQQLIYTPKLKYPQNAAIAHLCSSKKIEIEMMDATPEERIKFCEILLATADTMLKKVEVEYDFGKAHEDLGDTEKAKEHYGYAAQYGGSSIYCKKAKDRLENLNNA